MKKSIAFFDFDGTITTKDTMLELIRYARGNFRFYTGFLLLSPYMVLMKLKVMSNQSAKEKMLKYFFSGMEVGTFNQLCHDFSVKVIPSLIRPGALEKINELKSKGTEVVLVSASAENWLTDWCRLMDIAVIASVLEVQDGKITGRLIGLNCHGDEKVCRIKNNYDLSIYTHITSFGDTSGDKPMLALANESFYKPFR